MRILIGCLLCAVAWAQAPSVAADRLTADQWRADLKVLAEQLPKQHKNLFYTLPKENFDREVLELDKAIPGLRDDQIRAGFVNLVASAANVHTSIDAFRDSRMFPISFLAFAEGYFATATTADFAKAPAARLVAINGMRIEEVERRLLPYVAQENSMVKLSQLPNLLRMATPLRAAGVIDNLDRATFTLEREGQRFDAALVSTDVAAIRGARAVLPMAYRENRDRRLNYWFEPMPDEHAVYVQYNSCEDAKNESFRDFTSKVMKSVDSTVQRLVVDLRFNGGGNSQVIRPLVSAVQSRRKDLHVFVLVGRNTYSSAFMGALDLQNAGGILVGEAMGQKPYSFGEVRTFRLPNSGLTVQYATKFFQLGKDVPQMEPGVPVALTAADFFLGTDAAIDYALTH